MSYLSQSLSKLRSCRRCMKQTSTHRRTGASWDTMTSRYQSSQVKIRAVNHRALPFIYASGAFGLVMFALIVKREIDRARQRFRGFEKLSIPEFGPRSVIHRHEGAVLFDAVSRSVMSGDVAGFAVRPDDVWVVSFPRSGTTWIQEIIYLIETRLDFKAATSRTLDDRFPYLEFEYPGMRDIEKLDSPRFIKSHLPYQLLPKSFHEQKPKVVYIARNPRDVMLSYYFYARLLKPLRFTGDFAKFSDLFLKNLVPYAPWWDHVLQFWLRRHDDNVLFITYEQLHKNTGDTIREVAAFLGKTLSDEDVAAIEEHCGFEAMKQNDSVNHSWFDTLGLSREGEAPFMRSGEIGGWQAHFTPHLNVRVEQMLQFRLNQSALYFDYYPAVTDGSGPGHVQADSDTECYT